MNMKNILIIEDSKTINNILHKELKALGFTSMQAFTLKEAKEQLVKHKFDLIILDLHLPDGEGSELIANIQSLTRTKVVVLTSLQDADLREELFQYGILDYIVKDTNFLYSITEIVKIINTLTKKQQDKILLIDDSRFICKQIKTILEPRNYIVKTALNAKTAIEKLQQDEFNLIILDMELPDMHGLELLEFIRRDIRFVSIPVIVLSGTSTPEIVRDVLKNGANDFLKKPYVFEEFILKVDLWIDYFKKTKELEEKTLKLQYMNDNLERLVYDEVEKNRKKDKMMFSQSRYAQMGEMIAMIAHQWRQPLNAISAATIMIEMRAKSSCLKYDEAKKITQKIQGFVNHLSNTIDDFRNFFRPQKEKKVSNFKTIVETALSLIRYSLQQKNIDIVEYTDNVENFLVYENELVQVVLNLLKNAEDALIEKSVKDPKIILRIDGKKLIIEDNAGGVATNIMEKIFDPYFSTKDNKNGTGLGLYMAKVIVEEHLKGALLVKNTKEGAQFIIDLSQRETDAN